MLSRVFFLALFGLLSTLAPALAGTNPEDVAWLAAKAKEDGVVTLASGLMYRELRAGAILQITSFYIGLVFILCLSS